MRYPSFKKQAQNAAFLAFLVRESLTATTEFRLRPYQPLPMSRMSTRTALCDGSHGPLPGGLETHKYQTSVWEGDTQGGMNFNSLHSHAGERKCQQQKGILKEFSWYRQEIAWWAGKKAQWLEHLAFLEKVRIWFPAPMLN